MKAKRFILPFAAVLGVSLFSASGTYAEENVSHTTGVEVSTQPSVEEYDGDGNLIKSYSQEEIEKIFLNKSVNTGDKVNASGDVSAQATSTYKSIPTTIKDNVNVKGGAYFPNPGYVLIDPIGKVPHIIIRAYNSSGKVSETHLKNFYGSVSVPYTNLARGKSYRFNLANGSPSSGAIYLDFVQVGYNYN
ncbi:hypothetical protein COK01_24870 [Priestia megaterium]|uniref:hypothetical protein n=1 Tax=Priestia megaterium TaxID=1404 RepID=UPI000BF42F5C|nr:hypothetical protein [Priestia megaterium]PFP45284.1 hypothetical protein COK01_24870 [Priestia megaterium]